MFKDKDQFDYKKTLSLLIIFFAIFSTSSRASVLMCMCIILFLFIIYRKNNIFKINKSKFYKLLYLIIFIILYFMNYKGIMLSEDIFEIVNNRIAFITDTYYFLSKDLIQLLIGYGFGNGGISVVQTYENLPVNTVDNIFIIDIVNYGLIIFIIKNIIYIFILKEIIILPNDSNKNFILIILITLFISQFLGSYLLDRSVSCICFLIIGCYITNKANLK